MELMFRKKRYFVLQRTSVLSERIEVELMKQSRPKPQWGLLLITILLALGGVILRIWLTSDFSNSSVDPFRTVLSFFVGTAGLIAGYLIDYSFGAKHIRGMYITILLLSVYFLIFSPKPMGFPFHIQYIVLFFPILYAFWLYACRGKGWKGLLVAIAGEMPLMVICCIANYTLGGLLVLASGFVLLLFACLLNWFSIGRLKSVTLLVEYVGAITGILVYRAIRSEQLLYRIETAIHPETDPLGLGYYGTTIRRVLALSKWIGEGTWNGSISQYPFDRYLLHSSNDAFLTTVIFKLGWLPFFVILLVFVALVVWMMLCMMQQKSQLGQLVIIAVVMTLLVQLFFSLMYTLGITLLGAFFPLLAGNVNMVINMAIIGLALSVFREDSIAQNKQPLRDTFIKSGDLDRPVYE